MRSGGSRWVLAALLLAACGGEAADAAPVASVATTAVAPIDTVAPITLPDLTAPAPTLPPTDSIDPSVTTTLAPPAPVTTVEEAPTTVTVPPSTEPPLTLPLITLSTVPAPIPTMPAAPPAPTTTAPPASSGGGGSGGGLGRIEIPKLGISSGLHSGVDLPSLNRGPGHWPGTAMPGQSGNVVIAGHRTSHGGIFRNINSLGAGDQIIFENANGRHVYVVTGTQIVNPDAMWIIGQGGGSRATLFACHPPGSTAQRIVVFAKLSG